MRNGLIDGAEYDVPDAADLGGGGIKSEGLGVKILA